MTSSQVDDISNFIARCVKDAEADGVVVGVSGGLDSAVCATLAVRALGVDNVLALFLPSLNTPLADRIDAQALFRTLGLAWAQAGITCIVDAFGPFKTTRNAGNISARVRMTMLYAQANANNLLVMGTSDRSEIEIGYFTKWGDGAADILPIAHLYKTQVRTLAREIGVSASIIEKPSSPALVLGQTAEGEIGFSYEDIDDMLMGKKAMDPRLGHRIAVTQHKRLGPTRL